MTSADPFELAALVAQRLCHDLVNPLGAVGNGLELLVLSQPGSEETALMADSLVQAMGRLRLYRLAFGPAPEGGRSDGADLAAGLEAIAGARRVRLVRALAAEMPRAEARLAALLALCAETALAWGGTLTVETGSGAVRVRAEAARLRLDPDLWAALAEGRAPDRPTPQSVQFALAVAAARAAGRRLTVTQDASPENADIEITA